MYFMLRKSSPDGVGWIDEEISSIGSEEFIQKFVNLYECSDGVYSIVCVNNAIDWESGAVEDWDYQLVPFES
jgi:hypothetical protein